MFELTRLGVALTVACGFSATAQPLTTCRDAKGWTLVNGNTIPAVGRVLRARETPKGFELEVSDGRQWSVTQHDGAVQIVSGAVEGLSCDGAMVREPLAALVTASKALAARSKIGVCRAGTRFETPVVAGPVVGGGAVEVQLAADDEHQWTLVLTALDPVAGSAARCFSSAGRHCEVLAVPSFDWGGRLAVRLQDVRLECSLDRESLARWLR